MDDRAAPSRIMAEPRSPFGAFLGETEGPFLGADLLLDGRERRRGRGGSAPRRRCLEAAEHPATLNEQVDRQAQPATACGSSCSISAWK